MEYSIQKFIKKRPKTKIVCTIGPASSEVKTLKKMISEGMSVARLNLSHGTISQHKMYVENAKQAANELDTPLGILIDIPGPKYRVGKIIGDSIDIRKGQKLILGNETKLDGKIVNLKVWPEGISKEVGKSKEILLDDGLLKLNIHSKKGSNIYCTALNNANLKSNKSVTIPGSVNKLDYFTEETVKGLNFAKKINATFVGLSFIRNSKDIRRVKDLYSKSKFYPQYISKIELPSSVPHLKEIVQESDGVMVARGDLGVQLPIEKVPAIQKKIIKEANIQGKPVITATQMLESMIESASPTRAEATDIHNAVMDGTDAIMLSAETSIGKYPVESVINMAKISLEAELNFNYDYYLEKKSNSMDFSSVDDAIAYNACKTSNLVNAKTICAFTESGSTAGRVSSFRPKAFIIGLIQGENIETLLLRWGVIPIHASKFKNVQDMFKLGSKVSLDTGMAKKKDLVVVIAGMPIGIPGNTNLMRVIQLPEPSK
ncbi:MAG: pyruvate kinase [Dehalococcoidia bacterium]|nr:pyruvate kinase [Chloroflexota bacterium]